MAAPPIPFVYRARLVRVVDGDTLDLMLDLGFHCYRQERVRLAGVDTPELFGPKATQAGKAAKEYVLGWLDSAIGDVVGWPLIYSSETYDAREKYGRSLGVVYAADGSCLNDALVDMGWGA